MNRSLVVLLFLLGSKLLIAQEIQTDIQNLIQELKMAPEDTAKVLLYQKIAGHYNVTAIDSAKIFADEGLALTRKLDYKFGELLMLNVQGNYLERKAQYDSALVRYNLASEIGREIKSIKGLAIVVNNIAMIETRKGNYDAALKGYFEALRYEEQLDNRNGIAQAYNNIGVVYYYQGDLDKTTSYLKEGLAIQEELGNLDGLQNGYNNIGAIYSHQKKYDDAIAMYKKALGISREIGDKKQESSYLSNIAQALSQKGEYVEAEKIFNESLAIRKSIEDYYGMANSYVSAGEVYAGLNKLDVANAYLEKAVAISKEYDIKLTLQEAYLNLSELAKKRGDFKNSNVYLEQFIAVKDSLFNETKTKAIADVEAKYQNEKKENEILAQRAQLAEKELEVKHKNALIYGGFGLATLLGLIGYLFVNQLKLKNRQLKKENQLKVALSKLEVQDRLQQQRLRISRDLHDNIGSQLTFIISSIDNLEYLVKDGNILFKEKLNTISSFTVNTINELRDTIWAMNKETISFGDLKVRVQNLISKVQLTVEKQRFETVFDDSISKDLQFTAVEGVNLYRIIQEAVNNAMKYSDADEVVVKITKSAKDVVVLIKDNGKGFDLNSEKMGNGLSNIKRRAEEIKAEYSVDSKLGQGTQIHVSLRTI